MTLETAGAWKTVEQSLTLGIKSLLVQTSIHDNTHAITIVMANMSVGSDLSFLLFHAKEIFVQLNKGFSEIIIVSERVKFLLW